MATDNTRSAATAPRPLTYAAWKRITGSKKRRKLRTRWAREGRIACPTCGRGA